MMKRVFPRQSQALALMLAVSVTVVTPCASQAMSWNPMNWMPDKSSSQDVQAKQAAQSASEKAEEAQRAAEEALKQAQLAKERADKAKEAADALNAKAAKKQAKAQKAVVTSPTALQPPETSAPAAAPEAVQATQSIPGTPDNSLASPDSQSNSEALKLQITPSSTPEAITDTANDPGISSQNPAPSSSLDDAPDGFGSADASTNGVTTLPAITKSSDAMTTGATSGTAPENTRRGNAWNPTNWLYDARHDTFKEKPVTKKASVDQPAAEESEKPGNRTPWNPMSWFGGDNAAATVETPKAEKRQSAQEQTETPAVNEIQSEKTMAAVVETEKGNIAFEFYPDAAPETVHNFIKLANDGFYNKFNMRFHRVIPGFVIQTGDPTGTGAGGAKERVPLEVKNKLSHNAKGIVAMARGADPNSGTSQFYITLAPQTSLDGKYTIFGKVISGMDVLDKIEKGDMMYGVKIVNLNTITRDPQPEKKSFFSSLLF